MNEASSDEDEPMVRPFVPGPQTGGPVGRQGRLPGGLFATPAEFSRWGLPGAVIEDEAGEVRPYLLTGGRTHVCGAAVAMETVVLATGGSPPRGRDAASLERYRILQLCQRPCSAAEVAARLALPLAVALVLVTDLVADGLLDASCVASRQADDVPFLERLIAGVAAL